MTKDFKDNFAKYSRNNCLNCSQITDPKDCTKANDNKFDQSVNMYCCQCISEMYLFFKKYYYRKKPLITPGVMTNFWIFSRNQLIVLNC